MVSEPNVLTDRIKGGRFNKGNSKSEVDWMIYEASTKPSPAKPSTHKQEGALRRAVQEHQEEI